MSKLPARLDDTTHHDVHNKGKIINADSSVTFEDKLVARAGDTVKYKDGTKTTIKEGNACVVVNNKRIVLLDDKTEDDGKINSAASSIHIDEGKPFVFIGPNVHIGKNVSFNTKKQEPEKTIHEIETLNLAEPARKAAYLLKNKYPNIKFTSGQRDTHGQTQAMAGNVIKSPKWIGQTYRKSKIRDLCQQWVDQHTVNGKLQVSQKEVEKGLQNIFDNADENDVRQFSKHFVGMAFDIHPMEDTDGSIRSTIKSLPDVDKFFEKEGNLKVWHVQFK